MSNMTIQSISEFFEAHGACAEAREWAEATCGTMHDVWRWAPPEWLVWVATRPAVLTNRELRLLAAWSVRRAAQADWLRENTTPNFAVKEAG